MGEKLSAEGMVEMESKPETLEAAQETIGVLRERISDLQGTIKKSVGWLVLLSSIAIGAEAYRDATDNSHIDKDLKEVETLVKALDRNSSVSLQTGFPQSEGVVKFDIINSRGEKESHQAVGWENGEKDMYRKAKEMNHMIATKIDEMLELTKKRVE